MKYVLFLGWGHDLIIWPRIWCWLFGIYLLFPSRFVMLLLFPKDPYVLEKKRTLILGSIVTLYACYISLNARIMYIYYVLNFNVLRLCVSVKVMSEDLLTQFFPLISYYLLRNSDVMWGIFYGKSILSIVHDAQTWTHPRISIQKAKICTVTYKAFTAWNEKRLQSFE